MKFIEQPSSREVSYGHSRKYHGYKYEKMGKKKRVDDYQHALSNLY